MFDDRIVVSFQKESVVQVHALKLEVLDVWYSLSTDGKDGVVTRFVQSGKGHGG